MVANNVSPGVLPANNSKISCLWKLGQQQAMMFCEYRLPNEVIANYPRSMTDLNTLSR